MSQLTKTLQASRWSVAMPVTPKKRFVAFLDILGISELTKDETSSEKYVRALYGVLSFILKREDFYEFEHVRCDDRVEVEIRTPADPRARVTALSDALVISLPEFSDANEIHGKSRLLQILKILETISHVQSSLAAIGLLSRGGLASGPLIHTRNVVVGFGLVKAYNIESKRSIFPRTVVDRDIIDLLLADDIPSRIMGFRSRIAHAISIDSDGEYYVEYFGFQPISGGVLHQREHLERISEEKETAIADARDDRVVRKLEWFYKYVQESLNSYSDPIPYLMRNQGTSFYKRYPRIFENLGHMTDNVLANGFYKDPFVSE